MLNFDELCVERPIGSDGNNGIINLLNKEFSELEYKIIELPFNCSKWETENSFIEQNNKKIEIFPSPFSKELKGIFPIKYVSTLSNLKSIKDFNGVLVFKDELTKAALMPNNFPFYFPDEDKLIYEIISGINPKGIITISGQDPVSGLNPFPIFEDVNFQVPSAYAANLDNISENDKISIEINSKTNKVTSKQIIYKKDGSLKDVVLIAAHMDSKYFTEGAIDNASGIYTLIEIAKLLKLGNSEYSVEIVPFNGEDSPEVSGQLAYLDYFKENNLNIKLVINIDGVGHIGSENHFSFYNFNENVKSEIITKNNLTEGEQWYSGDHSIFAFQEIPCIAIVASSMFSDLMKNTIHTKKDKKELVDIKLLEGLSKTIIKMLDKILEKTQ
ncbi:MAG: M28 family metallopeptidase [Treponema sp.]|nr:M28 family metallopeptidase [Treponema sp.]